MSICSTPSCPASNDRDEFERPTTVEHGAITQPVLGSTGHHLLNRQQRGELIAHLKPWTHPELQRADADLQAERERVLRYALALEATQLAVIRAMRDRLDSE